MYCRHRDRLFDEFGVLMKRCVIIGSADIGDYARIKSYFTPDDFFVFCDGGLRHREGLGVNPSLIVGDFDSTENPNLPVETIVLPCEKDDTDTVFATKEALSRGFEDFLLVGVVGARMDHTLGNISILDFLDKNGKSALIVDDFSEIEIVSENVKTVEPKFSYFSILNIFGSANCITVKNAKYPLQNAEITTDYQYGISNEVVGDTPAEISLSHGKLLLIKVF